MPETWQKRWNGPTPACIEKNNSQEHLLLAVFFMGEKKASALLSEETSHRKYQFIPQYGHPERNEVEPKDLLIDFQPF